MFLSLRTRQAVTENGENIDRSVYRIPDAFARRANGAIGLAYQLIAAKLNILAGARVMLPPARQHPEEGPFIYFAQQNPRKPG